jgi:hypothetical protein
VIQGVGSEFKLHYQNKTNSLLRPQGQLKDTWAVLAPDQLSLWSVGDTFLEDKGQGLDSPRISSPPPLRGFIPKDPGFVRVSPPPSSLPSSAPLNLTLDQSSLAPHHGLETFRVCCLGSEMLQVAEP